MKTRAYVASDFEHIQQLNREEGWTQLVERGELTDTTVSLYVCELLVASAYRKRGLGEQLLQHVHALYPDTRLEMLASQASHTYYEKLRFRPFYGFRKTIHE